MRRRVRTERARANDLEAEQRTVYTKLTVPSAAMRIIDIVKRGLWALVLIGALWAIGAAVRDGTAEVSPGVERDAATGAWAAASAEPAALVEAPEVRSLLAAEADEVDAVAQTLPRLHSLLVSLRGELLFERYYNGRSRDRLANIKSASKSVISALVGIAVDRRLIPDVQTPIATYFPELASDSDARKTEITVEHLLTMRPGLEGTSNRNYGAWVTSRDWVRHVLARPMFAAPGAKMEYSTGNTHLLSAILTKAATITRDFHFGRPGRHRYTPSDLPRGPDVFVDLLQAPDHVLSKNPIDAVRRADSTLDARRVATVVTAESLC